MASDDNIPPMPKYRRPHAVYDDDCYRKLWYDMKRRCYDPKFHSFKNYGARGITVYKPWLESWQICIKAIIQEIGPRPSKKYSLDRINNDGNYEPGNIRWATPKQQANNRIILKGEKCWQSKIKDKDISKILADRRAGYTLRQIAEKYQVTPASIWLKIKNHSAIKNKNQRQKYSF